MVKFIDISFIRPISRCSFCGTQIRDGYSIANRFRFAYICCGCFDRRDKKGR